VAPADPAQRKPLSGKEKMKKKPAGKKNKRSSPENHPRDRLLYAEMNKVLNRWQLTGSGKRLSRS